MKNEYREDGSQSFAGFEQVENIEVIREMTAKERSDLENFFMNGSLHDPYDEYSKKSETELKFIFGEMVFVEYLNRYCKFLRYTGTGDGAFVQDITDRGVYVNYCLPIDEILGPQDEK